MDIESKNRIKYLDILRIFACICVLIQHSMMEMSDKILTSYSAITLLVFAGIAAPTFFMISGALLLPIKGLALSFLKKRFQIIMPPLIIWSIIYFAERYFTHTLPFSNIGIQIISMTVVPIEGILWFLYVLISVYLIMPIMSIIIKASSRRTIEYILCIWIASTILPYISSFIPNQYTDKNMLAQFAGYLGYPLLGYYLNTYKINHQKCMLALCMIVAVVLPVIVYNIAPISSFLEISFNDLGINTVLMASACFVIAKIIYTHKDNRVIADISRLTFGIYLVHILLLRHIFCYIKPFMGVLPITLSMIIVAILCFVLSYIVVKIISYLPLGKYIVR